MSEFKIIEINGKPIMAQDKQVVDAYKKVTEENANKKNDNSIFNVTLSKPEGVFKALEDLSTKEAGLNDFIIDYDLSDIYDHHLDDNSIKKMLEDNCGEDYAAEILSKLESSETKEESNLTNDTRSRFEKIIDGSKELFQAAKDGVSDGANWIKGKFAAGKDKLEETAEKAAEKTKETAEKVTEKTKEAAEKATEATKKAAKKAADTAEHAAQATKDTTVNTYNNMNKGMKYSLFGVSAGAVIAGVSKLAPKFLKNATALKVLSRTGIFGAVAGIASLIAYGIFATKNVNKTKAELSSKESELGSAKDEMNAQKKFATNLEDILRNNLSDSRLETTKAKEAQAKAEKAKTEAEEKAKKAEEEKIKAEEKAKKAEIAKLEAEGKAKEAEEEKDAAIKNKAKADENAEKQKYLANVYREAARKMRLYNFITCTDDEYSKKYEAMVERVKLGDQPVIRSAR